MSDFIDIIKKGINEIPHHNKVEEHRKEVYRLSKFLDDEDGYKLMRIFEETINQAKKLQEKRDKNKARP